MPHKMTNNIAPDSDDGIMKKKPRYMLKSLFLLETKLVHLNWSQGESNLRPRREAHSQISNQYY